MSYSLNNEPNFELLAEKDQKKQVSHPILEEIRYTHVYITHSGLALKNLNPIDITFFNNISEKRRKSLVRYARIKRFTEKKIRTKEPSLFLHHIWSNGYHHWLVEVLLKACFIKNQNIPIYLPSNYPAYAFSSLKLLGFTNIIKLPTKTGVKAKKAVLVPNPTSGHFEKDTLHLLRNKIFNELEITEYNTEEKLYISRKNASLRRIKNEEELIKILKQFNYKIINAEELSFEEQVKLFSQCKVLVSVHGAGLTNCLFMPKNSFLFEIYRKMQDEQDYMNLCYYRMTKKLNLHYIIQFAEVIESYKNVTIDRQDIIVDIEIFKQNLLLIEKSLDNGN